MKVLLLASYCSEEDNNCSEDLPCEDCLKMCNIIEIEDSTSIKKNYDGWDYNMDNGGVI